MALHPSCNGVQPPLSPASSSCQRKKCKCICFTPALFFFFFFQPLFRGQMQCVCVCVSEGERERQRRWISVTNRLAVASPWRTRRRFPFFLNSVLIQMTFTLLRKYTWLQQDDKQGTEKNTNKQTNKKPHHFRHLSVVVLQFLRLHGHQKLFPSCHYVGLPLTYQKANNIN